MIPTQDEPGAPGLDFETWESINPALPEFALCHGTTSVVPQLPQNQPGLQIGPAVSSHLKLAASGGKRGKSEPSSRWPASWRWSCTVCGAAPSASNPSRNRQRWQSELPIRQPERVAINRSKGLKDNSESAKALGESGNSKSISCPGDCVQGPGRNRPSFR